MKVFKIFAGLVLALALIFGCGSSPKTNTDQLDLAIREASDYLNNNVPRGSKIVILNIQSDSPALTDYIIDELISNAVSDRIFTVVDRHQLDAIRAEQNFQFSGEVSDRTALEIGQFLGAQTIVSGAIGRLGSGHRLRIRALEVQTTQVQGQFNKNITASPIVADLSSGTPATATAQGNRQTQPAATNQTRTQATPAQAQPTQTAAAYSIGQTGPAGGLIFSGTRNSAGVWTYYEAAPVEAEFRAAWSVRNTNVENTQNLIGSGRRNTQLIVQKFSQISGEWDTAAQKCAELVFGGFNDWFLPSQAELDQMYGNLKRRNLGDFKNEIYWASNIIGQHSWGDYLAGGQDFSNGGLLESGFFGQRGQVSNRYLVRPIRSFTQ